MIRALFDFEVVFHARACCFLCAANTGFTVLSVGFPYFTKVVQLLCSLSRWLYLNCSSIGTGFNAAGTNFRIARNLGILLMTSNSGFAIYFQQHSSYVCSDIYRSNCAVNGVVRLTTTQLLSTVQSNVPCMHLRGA